MALFRRRSKEPMDSALTFMTAAEADDLRSLVVEALAEKGIEASATGGEVTCDNGTMLPLWDPGTMCGAADQESWPSVVREHLEALANPASERSPADLSGVDALGLVKYRLAEESYVRFSPTPPADVVEFAPGIVRHLVLDLPDSVETVPAQVLLDKAPILALREAAEANTRAVLDEPWQVEHAGQGAAAVHLIVGESLFTATLALYLPEVVARVAPEADLSAGVIVAAPSRHQLGLHVPVDAAVVRELLPTLSRYASHGYDEGAGPISPHLYYWHDGAISTLTSSDASGRATITPTGPLHTLLGDTPR